MLGALGLPQVAAPHASVGDAQRVGFVSAPDAPEDTRVVEGKPLAWSAVAERNATGTTRSAGRSASVTGSSFSVLRGRVPASCAHDTRHASRMTRAALRAVDVRREIFRTHPARRVGGAEAAPPAVSLSN